MEYDPATRADETFLGTNPLRDEICPLENSRAKRTTKTASGKRTIPLNARAVEAVQHLKAQAVDGCPSVFATQTGKNLSYRNLLAVMEKACAAENIEHRGLHALRHSFASNLFARGVSVKVISRLLGHSSTQVTIDRYVHLFKGDIDDTLRQAVGA